MDISKYLTNTDDLEAKIAEANIANARARETLDKLEAAGLSEQAITAALDAEFGTHAAPKPARTRAAKAPRTVSTSTADVVYSHLDDEGLGAQRLADVSGLAKPTVLAALKALVAAERAIKRGSTRSATWSRA